MNRDSLKIKYLNKKIVSTALALTLVTTSLTGCVKDFEYERNYEEGNYVVEATGVMDSNTAENLKVIELDVCGEKELFLARRYDIGIHLNDGKNSRGYTYEYWDVFEDFKIISLTGEVGVDPVNIDAGDDEITLIKEEALSNYLLYYDCKKGEYTSEDLRKIFNKIEENYEFENNKQLVKE